MFYFSVPPPWVNHLAHMPILSDLKFFDLYAVEIENISFLNDILNCMPNLIQFTFTFTLLNKVLTRTIDVMNGYFWEDLLSQKIPHLCKFDFFISVLFIGWMIIDIDPIIDSFEYFVTHYDAWHMSANRWISCIHARGKFRFKLTIEMLFCL